MNFQMNVETVLRNAMQLGRISIIIANIPVDKGFFFLVKKDIFTFLLFFFVGCFFFLLSFIQLVHSFSKHVHFETFN